MDPAAHTLTGAALAAAGLRRVTPLATAALIIGANAPDMDVVTMLFGDYLSVAHRRGWTHGLPAMLVLPFLVTGALLLWDRHVRRRRQPDAIPVRPWALLALAALGVVSHPVLDWLNNYGMRWFMPFDDRWFYGDALFIIDPWVWLALGGVSFLAFSRSLPALAAWGLFWALASWIVLTSALVPPPARALWVVGVATVVIVRLLPFRRPESLARVAVAAVAVYMAVNAAANLPAREQVREALAAREEVEVTRVMVSPSPANPFEGFVVAATADTYYFGTWRWFATPRFRFRGRFEGAMPGDPVFEAAATVLPARRFLTWARFPYAQVEPDRSGYRVRFFDARYAETPADVGDGPVVWLDDELGVRERHGP